MILHCAAGLNDTRDGRQRGAHIAAAVVVRPAVLRCLGANWLQVWCLRAGCNDMHGR